MTTYRVDEHEGRLCVVADIPADSEPIMYSHYWPIRDGRMSGIRANYPGIRLEDFTARQSRPGEYWLENKREYINYYAELENGGATQPIKTETRPIPAPKRVKGDLEYRVGKWWKRTKAKGWVIA